MLAVAAALALSVAAESSVTREATVADLTGLGVNEIAERLGVDHRTALSDSTFAMAAGRGLVADARLPGSWRSGDRLCTRDGLAKGDFGDLALTLVDGRATAIGKPRRLGLTFERRTGPTPPELNPFTPAPGALPGQDGPDAVLARFVADGLPSDTRLSWTCVHSPRTASPRPEGPSVGEQVLAVPFAAAAYVVFAPYLATVPFQNARDRAARAAAPEVMKELQLGSALDGGAEGFARRWKRWTRLHPGDGGYVVGTVYLAGENSARSITFGARDGVVEWVGRNPLLDVGALCVGANGRFSGRRPGCSRGGYYDPIP